MKTIYIIFPLQYQITNSIIVLHRRSGLWWQVGEKFIHTFLSSFPWFSPVFMSVYIYLESHHTALSEVCKVRSISAYRWNLTFFVARHMIMRNSTPQGKETSPNIFGKEVDLARNPFHKQRIYHQKSINVQQSFRLGRRATLYYEGLISLACVSSEARLKICNAFFAPGGFLWYSVGIPVVLKGDLFSKVVPSGRKNVLRIPYRRLKAGFFVCWLCRLCLFVARVLSELHEVRTFAPSKAFLFDMFAFFFVAWKLLWIQNNQC